MVKRLETPVQSLRQEDLLEKEMATHSSILAWKIPWMEKPGRLQFMGSQRVGHDRVTSLSLFFSESLMAAHDVSASHYLLPLILAVTLCFLYVLFLQ